MSLEKQTKIDRIEVVENGIVQVRQATIITDNGNQISRTFHRWCIAPGEDYSAQDKQVQDICKVSHTPEVIAAYQTQQEARLGAV
jgi:hypothetical protein